MSKRWQVQEAKSRLSEVIDLARRDGPQIITKHGEDSVVVVAAEQFRALQKSRAPLSKFFRPLRGLKLDRLTDPAARRVNCEE